MQGLALEETAGPHPSESRLSGLSELLTLTVLQTAENKPAGTREAQRGCTALINMENVTVETLVVPF